MNISIRNYVVRNIILNKCTFIFIDMNSLYSNIYIYIGLYKINQNAHIQCALNSCIIIFGIILYYLL